MTRQEGFQAEQEATVIAGRKKHVAWQHSRWRRAVAMAMRPETHAGIPQQCLGWMKRRGAAPGCHEKGGEEKTIKYKSQQSQAETHTLLPPADPEDCWSTASQSSWEQKTFQKSRNYTNTALTLAYLHRACSWALDLGFVLDIFSASSSVFLNINLSSFSGQSFLIPVEAYFCHVRKKMLW